jgi:hypothetical protein
MNHFPLRIVSVTCFTLLSASVWAFEAENYVVVDTLAIKNPDIYEYRVLIADRKANSFIFCNAGIGTSNDRRFDKVNCGKSSFNQKGSLSHYRITPAPIEALRDPPYRNGKEAYWLIDPDTGKGEFCIYIDNTGPTCLDLPKAP